MPPIKSQRLLTVLILAASQISIYAIFALFQPLRFLAGDSGISAQRAFFFQGCVPILLLAFSAYIFFIKRRWPERMGFKSLAGIWLGLNFFLFLIWPITSSDLFSYIYQGRVASAHQANPYLVSYDHFSDDAFFKLINNKWSDRSSPYNPLFMFIAIGITFVAGDHFLLTVGIFKLLMVFANIGCGWLIYKIAKDKTIFFAYAFNPLVLFEFAINAHNDVLLIFFALAGLALWISKRPNLAWFSWLAAGLMKATGWLLLPLALILGLRQAPDKKAFWKRLAFLAGSGLAVYFFSYWCFFPNLSTLISKTGSIFEAAGAYSLGVLAIAELLKLCSISNSLAYALILGKLFFITIYGLLLWRLAQTKIADHKQLAAYGAIAYAGFFLFFFSWLMPWYFTVFIPLAILAYWHFQKKYWLWGLYFFTFYGIIYYISLR